MASEAAALPASVFVIRREEFTRITRSRDILAQAETEAEALLSRSQAEAEAERQRGYAEGLKAGQLQAARLLAEAAQGVEEFLGAREADLADLVFAVAFCVVGAIPEKDRMAGVIATAIADYRADLPMTLRTDAAGAAAVRQAVHELGLDQRVHVEAGAEVQQGRCMLVHAGGHAPIGLLDQFRAMIDAVHTRAPG
jgi:flagellar biosynthesis/type III secretory pathway protein FliH